MTLDEYMNSDDVRLFWRLESGEHLNLLDEAIERMEAAGAEAWRLRKELDVCRDLLRSVPEHSEAWYEDICDYLETTGD